MVTMRCQSVPSPEKCIWSCCDPDLFTSKSNQFIDVPKM